MTSPDVLDQVTEHRAPELMLNILNLHLICLVDCTLHYTGHLTLDLA